jgi:UDP-glucose 4-epimerase
MILITGGGGFIGCNAAWELIDRGEDVVLFDRRPFEVPNFLAPFENKRLKVVTGDILNLPFLYKTIRDYDVKGILHAAVALGKGEGFYEAMKVNCQGTVEILEAARIFGLERVTYLSSMGVYLPADRAPALHEDLDLPADSADYISAIKKAGEQICHLYAREQGLSVAIARPPLVWGPHYQGNLNPVKKMLESAAIGADLDLSHIYGRGEMVYVYVRDCARALSLIQLAPELKHRIYNISDGKAHCLEDFAEVIRKMVPGVSIRLREEEPGEDEKNIFEKRISPMSTKRIEADLGFKPEYDLERGVTAYFNWIRNGEY